MKFKFYIPAIILSLLAATSCSTINKLTGHSDNQTTTAVKQNNRPKTKNKDNKPRGKRNKKATTITEHTPTSSTKTTRPFTSADSIEITKKLTGEWIFDNVAGITITGEENRPTLTFDENAPRFYATNSCNYYNGDFSITGFNTISFNNVISTGNICYDIPWADYITALWNVAANFYITNRGTEEYLDINDSMDRPLATLKRHQLTVLNGLWSIVEINGRNIEGDSPTIVIDLLEKTVHGNTGCNLFNGNIYQDPDTDRSVQFQNMAVTRMACPNTAIETAFLVALEQVEKATIDNDDQATLSDSKGRILLKLQRTSL